jgi:hypothetical protein
MQIVIPTPDQHGPITRRHSVGQLQLCHTLDLLELRLGPHDVALLGVPSKSTEDVTGFFETTLFDEPSGGFGEEEDGPQEDEEGEDLEGDGEPPTPGG